MPNCELIDGQPVQIGLGFRRGDIFATGEKGEPVEQSKPRQMTLTMVVA